jgi:hypothetical protein
VVTFDQFCFTVTFLALSYSGMDFFEREIAINDRESCNFSRSVVKSHCSELRLIPDTRVANEMHEKENYRNLFSVSSACQSAAAQLS